MLLFMPYTKEQQSFWLLMLIKMFHLLSHDYATRLCSVEDFQFTTTATVPSLPESLHLNNMDWVGLYCCLAYKTCMNCYIVLIVSLVCCSAHGAPQQVIQTLFHRFASENKDLWHGLSTRIIYLGKHNIVVHYDMTATHGGWCELADIGL